MLPKTQIDTSEATGLALKYMMYLASDEDRLQAFCAQSGLGENDLKARLPELDFQGFLLDHLLQNESELIVFATENSVKPENIMRQRAKLPGFAI